MKRICLAAAAAVLGLGSGPAWAEGPGADYFIRQDHMILAPTLLSDPNQSTEPSRTVDPNETVKPTSTPESGKPTPPDSDDELAETGSFGWGTLGLGLGVIVAGVGVLILIRKK